MLLLFPAAPTVAASGGCHAAGVLQIDASAVSRLQLWWQLPTALPVLLLTLPISSPHGLPKDPAPRLHCTRVEPTSLNSRSASASTTACCCGVSSASSAARAAAGLTVSGFSPWT
jgi:hypothetical protein